MNRLAAACAFCLISGLAHGQQQSYAGQESRTVKALSSTEIDDLLAGRGMGTAKAAELNHYPGPAHVLELKDRLHLTPEQEKRTRAIHASMQARASAAGKRVVDAERVLEESFAKGAIDDVALAGQVREAGRLLAEFRLIHLAAHLETKALMSPDQVARYAELRGYTSGQQHGGHKH
jgi:hypothetical protein